MGIFSHFYKAGYHQYERLVERTDLNCFNDIIDNSRIVLTTKTHKYLKYKNVVMPVVDSLKGYGVVRTVLTDDMFIKPE